MFKSYFIDTGYNYPFIDLCVAVVCSFLNTKLYSAGF